MDDTAFMREALVEAQKAYDAGETPIGCVIVKDGKIIEKVMIDHQKDRDALQHRGFLFGNSL